jgi:hypothetical protein
MESGCAVRFWYIFILWSDETPIYLDKPERLAATEDRQKVLRDRGDIHPFCLFERVRPDAVAAKSVGEASVAENGFTTGEDDPWMAVNLQRRTAR